MKCYKLKINNKMKQITIILIVALLSCNIQAQDTAIKERTLTQLDKGEQSIGLNLGILDYSTLTTELSYKREISLFNKSFMVGTDIAMPIFEPDFNDMRFKVVTLQTSILKKGNFDLSLQFAPTVTISKSNLREMIAIGEEIRIISGFYGEKWGVNFIINADFKNATKVEHTDYYKDIVYADVYDGWLQSPASNLRLSLNGIRKIGNFETNISIGYATTFKNSYMLFPPIFGTIGLKYIF